MTMNYSKPTAFAALAALAMAAPTGLSAQQQLPPSEPMLTVTGAVPADLTGLPEGPEIEGFISARKDEKMQVTGADGTGTTVMISDATEIRGRGGFLGISRTALAQDSLLNGLPVTVQTVQWGDGLVASRIKFRKNDLKTASMIRTGTAQGFAEQTAATEALRGRVGDIDKYNIKGTTNVYFDTGKWNLSGRDESELCLAASQADAMENALLLVVGYTDSVGSQDYNQVLSERRAGRVVNYLQQACGWKPWRMLTPTGMAEADPLADNATEEGKAQNRRVAVNILVSKSVDGL
ncbi:OmpA family protein [Parerythrobacter jejuensis]|uniref:OmpA family protein n=1 Tax=Parerythrobacter jejuensis TaxID=795812 RepID=A0A845AR08_9SPHN|nr:OmpA family protein [Parerythrobacter jejuensis]MXP31291.1 OmpA family protein [Parerythrobacter jejuensis]MXP34051.1 OmpA family protein [Parerythrobacter jejuensis]